MARRIVFPSKNEVELSDFALQMPDVNEVLVETCYSLMSIGTETTILHAKYDADTHFATIFPFPRLQTGMQSIGIISKTGPDVNEFSSGDIVFMQKAHASHWTLPASLCSAVPSGIDLKSACWGGLAKTAFRAAQAAPFTLGGSVLIIGAGPVGQMTLRWAVAAGMRSIGVCDLSPLRLVKSADGGATDCFASIAEITAGDDYKLVVDTTGNPAVFQEALALLAPLGKLILLGDTGYPGRQSLSSDMMTKSITVIATHDSFDRDGWSQRRVDSLFFDLISRGRFDNSGLITHEFSPAECIEAYSLASDSRENTMGILFDWTRP